MRKTGQIVLFRFPQTDFATGKLRPALLLGQIPGAYEDWLICMISSQLRQYTNGFDEIIGERDGDFGTSGLKAPSVIRAGRLAVVEADILAGAIGEIDPARLRRIKSRLAQWLSEEE